MMASTLMRLSGFNEVWHWFKNFIRFSPFAIYKIVCVKFEKIMIFKTLFFCPMPFFVIRIIGNILSYSFFLLFVRFLYFKAILIELFSALFVEMINKKLAIFLLKRKNFMIYRRLLAMSKKKVPFQSYYLLMKRNLLIEDILEDHRML